MSEHSLNGGNSETASINGVKLEQFCHKKLYSIVVITEVEDATHLLTEIVKAGKSLERLSSVYFITQEDVFDFVLNYDTMELPEGFKESFIPIIELALEEFVNARSVDTTFPVSMLAQIIKIKIVHVMYNAYKNAVLKMIKRDNLDKELTEFCVNVGEESEGKNRKKKKGKDKKGKKNEKSSKKSKSSKSSPGKEKSKNGKPKKSKKGSEKSTKSNTREVKKEPVIEDYTKIPIAKSDNVIFDYDIDNQVFFCVLIGFTNPRIIEKLHKIGVMTSSVIKFYYNTTEISEFGDDDNKFSLNLERFNNFKESKHLENTPIFKYVAITSCNQSVHDFLEELTYVIKRINYIKRQHVHYLKNLALHDIKEDVMTLSCMHLDRYNEILDKFPLEIVNIPLIIYGIIEEVIWRIEGIPDDDQSSFLSFNPHDDQTESEKSCLCPLKGLKSFIPNKPNPVVEKINPRTYQCHEIDTLGLIYNSYKVTGRKLYDVTVHYLEKLQILQDFHKFVPGSLSLKRGRDFGAPSEHYYLTGTEQIEDFLHLALFSYMKPRDFTPKRSILDDFVHSLVTYDQFYDFKKAQPEILDHFDFTNEINKTSSLIKNYIINNYHWKEALSHGVTLQLISKFLMDFSCCDRDYCEETDSYLLKFHDNLDDFGISTQIYNQRLPTPLCLRDFCKYGAVYENDFIDDNRIMEHFELLTPNEREECQGLKKIQQISGDLYEEYLGLFGQKRQDTPRTNTERNLIFNGILDELINYPYESHDFKRFYDNVNGKIRVYDLGTVQKQLIGASTIFHSYDGVKIIVDNTKFLDEDDKTYVQITCCDDSIHFHSQDPENFHLVLNDGTIIFITKTNPKSNFNEEFRSTANLFDHYLNELHGEGEALSHTSSKPQLPSINNTLEDERLVLGVSRSKFSSVHSENSEKLFLHYLKVGLDKNLPIFKTKSYKATSALKREFSSMKLPLFGIIHRILFKPKKMKKLKGFDFKIMTKGMTKPIYDFKLTLPNGLKVETLPIHSTSELVEFKQDSSLLRHNNKESYRIYYKTGIVLIKNLNGTYRILRGNGDIITLSDNEFERINGPWENRIDEMSKFLKRAGETHSSPYYASRNPKEKPTRGFLNLFELGGDDCAIPFTKKTVLNFSGEKFVEINGKITKEQTNFVLSNEDFHTREEFYERDDGMTCVVDKNGVRQLIFPDGTKMTSWYQFEDDSIYTNRNKHKDGWISIAISYKIEHPNYLTVIYDGLDRISELKLNHNDGLKIKSFLKGSKLNLKYSSGLSRLNLDGDFVHYQRICRKCSCNFSCKISMKRDDLNWFEANDSYFKKFTIDFRGNCGINSTYMKGSAMNQKNCNHYRCNPHYRDKELMIINRDLTGTLLWSNTRVTERLTDDRNCQNNDNCVSGYTNELTGANNLEFFTNIYHAFNNKFRQSHNTKFDCESNKFPNIVEKLHLSYVTYRILLEIPDLINYLDKISEFLENNIGLDPNLVVAIQETMQQLKEVVNEDDPCVNLKEIVSHMTQKSLKNEKSDKDKIAKNDDDIRSVHTIIEAWRNEILKYKNLIRNKAYSPYFLSDFYQKIKI